MITIFDYTDFYIAFQIGKTWCKKYRFKILGKIEFVVEIVQSLCKNFNRCLIRFD